MLPLFRNNSPFTVILLFIFALLIKLQCLLHPQLPIPVPGSLFYNEVLKTIDLALKGGAFGYTMLTIIMLYLQALFVNRIANSHKLFARPTYLPAYFFLLLTSILPPMNFFSEQLIMNWFLLAAINIMFYLGQTAHPRKYIFNAAFMLCIPALFQFSAIGYGLLLLGGLLTLRSFNLGEWVVGAMGFITPIYFFAGGLFLADRFSYLQTWAHINYVSDFRPAHPQYAFTALAVLFILFITGAVSMRQNLPKSTIYIRRNWVAVSLYFIVSLTVIFFTAQEQKGAWLLAMPSLSLVIAQSISLEKSKLFSNIVFYFSLIFVVICQFIYK